MIQRDDTQTSSFTPYVIAAAAVTAAAAGVAYFFFRRSSQKPRALTRPPLPRMNVTLEETRLSGEVTFEEADDEVRFNPETRLDMVLADEPAIVDSEATADFEVTQDELRLLAASDARTARDANAAREPMEYEEEFDEDAETIARETMASTATSANEASHGKPV